ncbi:hypothetical protein [Chryseobacterium sp. MMS23-Vi53]|uniref:hypothetical protein n=1 Tax=Chryseobacterium sp. MMS23-Vi53 TaxID=3386644 RepID=UPI0039EB3382
MPENILKKQLEAGQYLKEDGLDPTSKYLYSLEDYNIASNEIEKFLKSNMFKTENFEEKIFSIFGIKNDKKLVSIFLDSPCSPDETIFYASDDGSGIMSSYKPVQIDFGRKILLEAFYIPEVIDYRNEYPYLLQAEKKMSNKIIIEGTSYTISKWMDDSELLLKQQKNKHLIFARNKYLFNDSKADFAWLKFNDIPFLESLVKTFGYVKDKDLLTFVLKNNYKKEEELSKILWNKKCNGEITVNKEVFDLVKKWPTEDRHTFLMYALFVVQNMKKDFESDSEFNFSQKARLLGLISYYATQIGNIDNTYAYSFFPMLSGKNYDEEFKKNNYYNIPDFQEVYEEARTGGVNTDNWVQPDITKSDSHETINQYVDKVLRIYDRADFNSFSKEIQPKGELEYVNKVNGWDFIKVDGTVGYIPTEEQKEAFANKPKRKDSFLADDEPKPMKKKGFWDSLFG